MREQNNTRPLHDTLSYRYLVHHCTNAKIHQYLINRGRIFITSEAMIDKTEAVCLYLSRIIDSILA